MWKCSAIAFACLLALTFAEEEDIPPVTFPGKCPQLNPVQDFDIEKYAKGTWYHNYHLRTEYILEKMKCIDMKMHYEAEGSSVFFSVYSVTDGLPVYMNATYDYINPGTFQYPESVRNSSPMWYYKLIIKILKVDYDNYVIGWGCYDDEKEDKHYESIFINGRCRKMSEQHQKEVKDYLAEHLPSAELQPANWDDCRVTCPAS